MCKVESLGRSAPFEPSHQTTPEATQARLDSERALDLYQSFVPLAWREVVVIGGTGEIGQVLETIPYGASQIPGALIRWASGRESYWFLRDLKVLPR